MNSNGTMFGGVGMCNPDTPGVGGIYGHQHHHQSHHYSSSPSDLGSPPYCGSAGSGGHTPVSDPPSSGGGGGGHPYGLQAAAVAAAAVAAQANSIATSEANTNNNRSNSVEASPGGGGQNSPTTGIISDNGLQYANLDGSGGPGAPPGSGYGYGGHPHHMAYHYSDIHGDGHLNSVAAAAAASGAGQGTYSASYLDNSAVAAAAAYSQFPSIYGQHHTHSLKSIRGHDFGGSAYPGSAADAFSAAAAVSKPSPAVPTYKWMQVKRNVPKPGKDIFLLFYSLLKLKVNESEKLLLEILGFKLVLDA